MRPQEIAEVRKDTAQYIAAARGDFATEIDRLTAATAAWDTRNNLDAERTAIAEARTKLDRDTESVKKDIAAHEARLNALQTTLVKREEMAAQREQAVLQNELDSANRITKAEQELEQMRRNTKIASDDVQAKLEAVDSMTGDLARRLEEVTLRENKVKAALARVSDLVA